MPSQERESGLRLRVARVIAGVLTVPYLMLLAAYTFAAESIPGDEDYNLIPLRTVIGQATSGNGAEEFVRQVGGNFVLLLPLGIVLGIYSVSTRWAVFLVVATSLLIELVQFTAVPSRSADIDDALLNITGGLVGLLVGRGAARALGAP